MINLQTFCAAHNDPRAYLRHPFSFGTYSAASNGHLVIMIPRRHDITATSKPNIGATATKLLDEAIKKRGTAAETGSLRLAEFEPDVVTCRTCVGTGRTYICPECKGNGELTIDRSSISLRDVPCNLCDQSGILTEPEMRARRDRYPDDFKLDPVPHRCESCLGIGKQSTAKTHQIGATLLSTHYLLLFKQQLPDGIVYTFNTLPDPALIVFTGGLGILMPMRG